MLCSTEGWLLVYIATQPSVLLHNMSPYLPTIIDWVLGATDAEGCD